VTRQTRKSRDLNAAVIEMRKELARKIAMHAQLPGENPTTIPVLALYRRTTPTACYRGTYEHSLSVFVQGRKRVNLGGTIYLCGGSSFLLSPIEQVRGSHNCRFKCRCGSICLPGRSSSGSAPSTCPPKESARWRFPRPSPNKHAISPHSIDAPPVANADGSNQSRQPIS
jgi:hypothetical protein